MNRGISRSKGQGPAGRRPQCREGVPGKGGTREGRWGAEGRGREWPQRQPGLVWFWPSMQALDGQARKLAPGPKPVLPKCDTRITSGT